MGVASVSFVYIAASEDRRLIIGITKDLEAAMYLLRSKATGWSSKLGVTRLVWFGECETLREAAECRSKLRRMGPKQRRALVEETNPEWRDLLPPKVAAGTAGSEVSELADLQARVQAILQRLRDLGIDPDNPGLGGVGATLPGWPDFPRPRAGADAAPWPRCDDDWLPDTIVGDARRDSASAPR